MKRSKTTITVRAAHADRPCPMHVARHRIDSRATANARESDLAAPLVFRTMIYADATVEVENSRYYRRRIAVGDLVEVKPVRVAPAARKVASDGDEGKSRGKPGGKPNDDDKPGERRGLKE